MNKKISSIHISSSARFLARRRAACAILLALLGCGALLASSRASSAQPKAPLPPPSAASQPAAASGPGSPAPARPPASQAMASAVVIPESATLVAPGRPAPSAFASAVAISGRTLVVGAPGTGRGPGAAVGQVYVYELTAAGWWQTQSLAPPRGQSGERFGAAVALSGDLLAVSAPQHLSGVEEGNFLRGEVYVYSRQGSLWQLQDTLYKGINRNSPHPSAYKTTRPFGEQVAISGNRIVVSGEHDHDYPHGFILSGSTWTYNGRLIMDSSDYRMAAHGPAIFMDNDTVVIGPCSRNVRNMGLSSQKVIDHAILVFTHDKLRWNHSADVYESYLPTEANEGFGSQFAISGNTLAIGIPRKQEDGKPAPGAVDFYVRTDSGWVQQYRLRGPQGQVHDEFGGWLVLSGARLVVGSIDRQARSHRAWFFVRRGDGWHPVGTRAVPGQIADPQAPPPPGTSAPPGTPAPPGLPDGGPTDLPVAFNGEVLVIGTQLPISPQPAVPERATVLRFPAEQ